MSFPLYALYQSPSNSEGKVQVLSEKYGVVDKTLCDVFGASEQKSNFNISKKLNVFSTQILQSICDWFRPINCRIVIVKIKLNIIDTHKRDRSKPRYWSRAFLRINTHTCPLIMHAYTKYKYLSNNL